MSLDLAHPADDSAVVARFEAAVREELREWGIGGLAVAWVDGVRTVYESGFGEARQDSVFRCGSISKLFNAVAVMQLVEAGKLELDAPVARHVPGLMPQNPFAASPAVTLRQLLSHRSGLPREAPTGGYFDPGEPGIRATVESLRGSVLVTAPDAMTRYSNIGATLAGHCVELATGMSYHDYQLEYILDPLGMRRSAWCHAALPAGAACLRSRLRVADGAGGFRRCEAPRFELGTIPAGNLYTTAGDLGRFLAMLSCDGDAPGGRVLAAGTLARMWQPQGAEPGSFGLGFLPGELFGRKTVGHGGAVYGHSAQLWHLPEERLGVVVLANEDLVNGRVSRLAALALELMLEAKSGARQAARKSQAPASLADFAGHYESQSHWAELRAEGGQLRGNFSSQPCVFVPVAGDTFLLRSRLHADLPVNFERDGRGRVIAWHAAPQRFQRVPDEWPEAPPEWQALHGCYGPELIPLVVFGKFGHLYAATENALDYRLTPLTRHVFAMPPGMYSKEHLVFHMSASGQVVAAELAGMMLSRHRFS